MSIFDLWVTLTFNLKGHPVILVELALQNPEV